MPDPREPMSLSDFLTLAERVLAHGMRLMTETVPKPDPTQPLQSPPGLQPKVRCPNCSHGINMHKGWGEVCGVGEERGTCVCLWTPNDIAATLTESVPDTTAAEETPEESYLPLAAVRWYHVWAADYPERAKEPIAAVLQLLSEIAFEDRELPLPEVVARLVLVIEGARFGDDPEDDNNPNHFWTRRAFIARSPITAFLAALGSDPFGNGDTALRRVRKVALIWLEMNEEGIL